MKSNSTSFPDNTGTAYSLFDAFYGLGCTLGPVIGAFLYALGGFSLPFWIDGAAIFVSLQKKKKLWLMKSFLIDFWWYSYHGKQRSD